MHMDSQNFDAIIREPCIYIHGSRIIAIYSYYDSAAVSHCKNYLVKMTTSAGYCSFRVHWPGGYIFERKFQNTIIIHQPPHIFIKLQRKELPQTLVCYPTNICSHASICWQLSDSEPNNYQQMDACWQLFGSESDNCQQMNLYTFGTRQVFCYLFWLMKNVEWLTVDTAVLTVLATYYMHAWAYCMGLLLSLRNWVHITY